MKRPLTFHHGDWKFRRVSVTDRFTEFVVDQLEACGPITSKRMFGGVGIYAADLFFAILNNDVLYLKVDDSNRADFERIGSGPFRPYGDESEVMQYYNVPVSILEDARSLSQWAMKAIAVARAKKAGASKRRVPSKKTGIARTRTKVIARGGHKRAKPAALRQTPVGRRRR